MEIGKQWGTLLIIEGLKRKEYPLTKDELYIGRSDPLTRWAPDIDLSPDFTVSRKHTRLLFKDDKWWIEDLGSKRGTFVGNNEEGRVKKLIELRPNVPVKTGQTKWVIVPSNTVYWKGLTIEIANTPIINYAAYHCGVPIISGVEITNHDSVPSNPFTLQIKIPEWSLPWESKIPSIVPGGRKLISKVELALLYEKLEGLEGRKKVRLEASADGSILFIEEIYVVGFYEWSLQRTFRKTLACFVQPAHPVVEHLTMESRIRLGEEKAFARATLPGNDTNYADRALKAIYENLAAYEIAYVWEPPSYEFDSQVVRPPHRMIPRIEQRQGSGTCLDLALLFASCLEAIYLQPLIILVQEEAEGLHALAGCWTKVSIRAMPILNEHNSFKMALERNDIILVETTGVTDRFEKDAEKKLSYEEAAKLAYDQVTRGSFLFAVDIATARQTIPPLQFPMEPSVLGIIRKARELALDEEENSRLETRHLLSALVLSENLQLQELFEKAGVDFTALSTCYPKSAWKTGRFLKPTVNYRRVLEDARLILGDTGDTFIKPLHILYALLLSQSKGIDAVLNHIGTNRGLLKEVVDEKLMWANKLVQTYYEDIQE